MDPVPPKISPARNLLSPSRFAMGVLTFAAVAAMAMLYFFNPSNYGFYPVCFFHQFTGFNCPGCGATRALYALLHGHFTQALRDNVLVVSGLAMASVRAAWFGLNRLRGRQNGAFFPHQFLLPLMILIGVFGLLRNLPAFSFLSP